MKKIYFAFVLLLLSSIMYSQPQITSAFNPVPGDIYKYHSVNPTITPGNSGAQVTWDFSTLSIAYNPNIGRYHSPASTPYAASFPGSTVAYEDHFAAGTYHFFTASSTKFEKLGDANVMLTAIYDNPAIFYTYPFTYNTKVTSTYTCSDSVGSMAYEKTGSWEAEGDAWGALLLSTGTHQNVLRIKTHHIIEDDYPGVVTNVKDILEYAWVSATTKKPLVKYTTEFHFTNGTPIDTLTYLFVSEEVSGINEPTGYLAGMSYWPNPASDLLNIGFEMLTVADITFEIYCAGGQMLTSNTLYSTLPGNHYHSISLDNLKPGFYILRVIAGDSANMIRFIKI